MQPIPEGFCQCGCGQPTRRIQRSCPRRGYVKGEFHGYLVGHSTRNDVARELEQKVAKSPGCWLWLGSLRPNGYGRINWKHGVISAHRAAWQVANGKEIPSGMVVMHACDVRRCINPEHLVLGTSRDNNRDTANKGHMRVGPSHHRGRVYSTADILSMRARHVCGESYAAIARSYHAQTTTVRRIVLGLSRSHGV